MTFVFQILHTDPIKLRNMKLHTSLIPAALR